MPAGVASAAQILVDDVHPGKLVNVLAGPKLKAGVGLDVGKGLGDGVAVVVPEPGGDRVGNDTVGPDLPDAL